MNFIGKKMMVVGASSGIGSEMVRYLDTHGAETILVARREDKLKEVADSLSGISLCIPFDLSKADSIENIFLEMKKNNIKLDGMVYCAGVSSFNLVKNMEIERIDYMFRINVVAFYLLCKYFCMPKYSNRGSSIVGISSMASLTNESGMSIYSMSKGAMNSAVKVMAKEFVKRRIRVNAVLPAMVKSKMADETNEWSEQEIEEVKSYQPLGIIPIEQVVQCIGFLLSDYAMYITGECIAISGGYKN